MRKNGVSYVAPSNGIMKLKSNSSNQSLSPSKKCSIMELRLVSSGKIFYLMRNHLKIRFRIQQIKIMIISQMKAKVMEFGIKVRVLLTLMIMISGIIMLNQWSFQLIGKTHLKYLGW